MGTAVGEMAAASEEFEVSDRYDVDRPLPEEKPSSFQPDDVVVDFTLPEVVLTNIRRYCRWNQPAVIGTTGWYDALATVREWAAESGGGLLYAPNFSLGVALLVRGLRQIAPLIDQLPAYDAYIQEVHHTGKVDSPSGTALSLAEELMNRVSRKERIETETQHEAIDPEALHVTSTRVGTVVGRHTVGFDSAFDTLSLVHEAKSRDGFAFGALQAAAWIQGRTGLFTLDHMFDDWMEQAGTSSPQE
jgi:4-hydroxy-tetrahydrodipicolinate reductase